MATYKEFAAKIKEKHPEYADRDDKTLAQAMVAKFPEYKDRVTFEDNTEVLSKKQMPDNIPPALKVAAQVGGKVKEGLGAIAEKAADFGWAGAPIGVPALMMQQVTPDTPEGFVGELAGGGAIGKVGKAAKAMKQPGADKLVAEAAQAFAAVPQKDTLQLLKDPTILDRAKSVADATKDYVKAIPGLKHVSEHLGEILGKVEPTLGDYQGLVDTVVNSGAKDPQAALSGIQAINNILRHKEFSRDPAIIRRYLEVKSGLLDVLDDVSPQFKGATNALREAHIKEQFSSLFPKNKNLSTNVLRTALATREGVAGVARLAAGDPSGLAQVLMAASASPKMWGKAIKAGSKMGVLGDDVGSLALGKVDDAALGVGEGLAKKATGEGFGLKDLFASKADDAIKSAPKQIGFEPKITGAIKDRPLAQIKFEKEGQKLLGYEPNFTLVGENEVLAREIGTRKEQAYTKLNEAKKALSEFNAKHGDSLKYREYAEQFEKLKKGVSKAEKSAKDLNDWFKGLKK